MQKIIYVAGPIVNSEIKTLFGNFRRGIRTAVKFLVRDKIIPFCPFLDFMYRFHLVGEEEIEDGMFYKMGIAFVEHCDAVYAMPGSENSKGVKMEIARAKQLGIPVFHNKDLLRTWYYHPDSRTRIEEAFRGGYLACSGQFYKDDDEAWEAYANGKERTDA